MLACVEEGLRHGGLGAVIGEVARLSMPSSRRLQLAAEGGSTIGIVLRRWRRQAEAADFGQPTAAMTRWRVSVLPSAPLPVPGLGRARWLVELIRVRAGESADFEVEACDATGRLALPPDLGHGPGAAEGRRRGLPAEAPLALAGREGDRRELRAATLHALDRGRRQARSARGLPPPFACLCAAATGAARGLDGPVRESSGG